MNRRAPIKWAFYGSSLVSAYWNGAATYYRGIIRALAKLGHEITFYEPDAYDRQKNRDMDDPEWARVQVYSNDPGSMLRALEAGADADMIVKCSGVGVFDQELESGVLALKSSRNQILFWDVDAPATLARIEGNSADPFIGLIPRYDAIFTYGGGDPVVRRYQTLGAKFCLPVYNALDPSTHFPVPRDSRYRAKLSLLANRLPDRERRVDEFFLTTADLMPSESFLLGGNGWADKPLPKNVRYLGHVYTHEHNAFNCTAEAVLNLSRDSMADNGFSPATRVFEAAGAAACLITDSWTGIELFLEPGTEVLVARNAEELVAHLEFLNPERARAIGHAANRRIRSAHTYDHRARQVDQIVRGLRGIA